MTTKNEERVKLSEIAAKANAADATLEEIMRKLEIISDDKKVNYFIKEVFESGLVNIFAQKGARGITLMKIYPEELFEKISKASELNEKNIRFNAREIYDYCIENFGIKPIFVDVSTGDGRKFFEMQLRWLP